jgi:hypothetical protein
MSEERKDMLKIILWVNLIIGIYNLYLYTNGGWLFNLIIGSLNIGAWVFNRNIIFKSTEK